MATVPPVHSADPQITPFTKFRELTEKIHVAMLTTRRSDGLLHSRPMGTRRIEADGGLCFFTADDSGKVREIYHDQMVNVGYADPAQQLYVSVAGKATLSHDRAQIRELWTPELKEWFPQGADDPAIALICVEIQAVDYWEGSTMVSLLKFSPTPMAYTPTELDSRKGANPPLPR